jgi:hypothetical protein
LIIDTAAWRPEKGGQLTLLTCGTASKAFLDALAQTAVIIPAFKSYRVFASEDGKALMLKCRRIGTMVSLY